MKRITLLIFIAAALFVSISCKKGDDEGGDCEEDNLTMVTYTNTGSSPLRIVVAGSLNAQYEPVDPKFTLDLPAGAEVVKEFAAGNYFSVWYHGCASGCEYISHFSRNYVQCGEYDEEMSW